MEKCVKTEKEKKKSSLVSSANNGGIVRSPANANFALPRNARRSSKNSLTHPSHLHLSVT